MLEIEQPVHYIPRTREYYRAIGYSKDYVWSCYEDVPFASLAAPLSQSRVAVVTTARPLDLSNIDARGVKHVWAGKVNPLPVGLNTDNLAWDRVSTHTEDRESYLPLEATLSAAREGMIAGLTARFYGVPSEYSQRKTIEEDAPKILALLREDGADAALISAL